MRTRTKVTLWVLGVILTSVFAFAVFQPIQVLPRIRLAPGFALTDAEGATLTSEDMRGSIVLYHFSYLSCDAECADAEATLSEVAARAAEIDLDGRDFEVVTISFDPERDTPEEMRQRLSDLGAPSSRHFATTSDATLLKTVIGSGFEAWYEEQADGSFSFDPVFVLVDGWGVIRGEYRYQVLAEDADRISRHIDVLGEELRNSEGAASVAYEAAHLFLCYP